MDISNTVFKNEEKAVFALRSLYERFGYSQYKMSKFEEYDLYVRNKDFLISDSIITFTDTNGKLMALKPDVTLSIIKNTKDEPCFINKLYYNENVYRISKGNHSYKEIMQTGLECMGDIDSYALYEVLMLACESLKTISDKCVLDISNLGILSDVLDSLEISLENRKRILVCAGEKNTHELVSILENENVSKQAIEDLKDIIHVYGSPKAVFEKLDPIFTKYVENEKIDSFKEITNALEKNGYGDMINIDFSVINDMNYYNGIVFKGFVDTIPNGVLSGGQYDKLMNKMCRRSSAVGFAVYLDMLERYNTVNKSFDVDTVILYDCTVSLDDLNKTVRSVATAGKSVIAQKTIPQDIKYRDLIDLTNKEG